MSQQDASLIKTIAVLGGTGKEGSALAKRWALTGYKVIIGSRSAEKAQSAVEELNRELDGDYLIGMSNEDATAQAGLVVISVPYSAHAKTLESVKEHLSGKILIDITVPLAPPKVSTVTIPEGGSAAQEAQQIVGDDVKVVSAFQNVSHVKLGKVDEPIDCDVFVSGDDNDAKAEVIMLIEAAGMRGIDVGPLTNAVVAESLTSVLIYVNKKYGANHAGIRITGLEK